MTFSSFTHYGQEIFNWYCKNNPEGQGLQSIIQNKLDLTGYRVMFITPDSLDDIDEFHEVSAFDLKEIVDAWRIIRGVGLTDIEKQEAAWLKIDEFGERMPGHPRRSSMILRRFRNSSNPNLYFLLLNEKEPIIFPLYELNQLCNLWQLEQGNIPIHSSAIVHHKHLFLFGGPSGAGKSTVSKLSAEKGDWVLDEDQLLLNSTPEGNCSTQAWGYSLQTTNVPLKAVFKLIQDTKDQIIPLTESQTAIFLLERMVEPLGFMRVNKYIQNLFSYSAKLARSIPGYELHFRKSPDFWNLIDAEFPVV